MQTRSDLSLEVASSDAQFREEVLEGLLSVDKNLPSKFFYDARGSELFTEITTLDEYYLTRTENSILHRFLPEIADALESAEVLIEYGSGDSDKTHLLLETLPRLASYVPIDVSVEQLMASARRLSALYPRIEITPYCADFTSDQEPFVAEVVQSKSVVFIPGSTIGNFEHSEATSILERIARLVGRGGGLLIGLDLGKDVTTVERAYNDRSGVTANFNKNILSNINSRLDIDFDLESFDHSAIYNHVYNRIEMYLVSKFDQTVHVEGEEIHFVKGERIRTEYSHKYPLDSFSKMSANAGFVTDHIWTDDEKLFSVQYLRVP